MLTDGTFEKLVVETPDTETSYSIEDVEFRQDGFSFTFLADPDSYPIFKQGYTVRGYIDQNVVAHGTITVINTTVNDGERKVRVSVSPPD